jgi:hydrogenase expression/formation protein HypD
MTDAKTWLRRLHDLPLRGKLRILNVCGGHERTISMAGLRGVLPDAIELIPGPGCPVCVCPEEDLFAAIRLACRPDVTLVAFGDMLRVPANGPKTEPRTLAQAQATGADVRPIASPIEAVRVARDHPERQVVFFAAGFETTMAPVAAMLAEGVPDNLSVLLSGRRTWPAVAMLLEDDAPGFDGLVAPGHVATIMGTEEWAFVPEERGLPAAVGGFTPESLLASFYSIARQHIEGTAFLDNCYGHVARREGNRTAQRCLDEVLAIGPASWRGIGTIAASGYELRAAFAAHDARGRFDLDPKEHRKRAGQMPAGCDCARVVLGKIYPNECVLYGRSCTPSGPIGPCMVSDEGACRIWWSAGVRAPSDGRPAPAGAQR